MSDLYSENRPELVVEWGNPPGKVVIPIIHMLAIGDRVTALRALHRLEEALASCDRAIALRPDHAIAHDNRGNILADLQRFDEAIEAYDHALAITPASRTRSGAVPCPRATP